MADEIINGLIERQIKASAVYQRGVEDERNRIRERLEWKGFQNVEELLNEPDSDGSCRSNNKENKKPVTRVRSCP